MVRNFISALLLVLFFVLLIGCGPSQELLRLQQENENLKADEARAAFITDSLVIEKARADSISMAQKAQLDLKKAWQDSLIAMRRADSLATVQLVGKKVALYRAVGLRPSVNVVEAFEAAGTKVIRAGKWYRPIPYATVQLFFNPSVYTDSQQQKLLKAIRSDVFSDKRLVYYNGRWAKKTELGNIWEKYGNDVIIAVYDYFPNPADPKVEFGAGLHEYQQRLNDGGSTIVRKELK